ncbi:MAG TPA: patatin-like phospholipase family protein [Longimicrobiales bacterium]
MRGIALAWPLILLASSASAQQAVVLGGGGARGLAHAGVLAGLEQLGYAPELVVGTSMGAIIGSLYAAGESPDAIRRTVMAQDWAEMFTHAPRPVGPRRELRYPALDIAPDPEQPTGLVADWRINRTLVRLLFDAGARSGGDFDRLPRRFRAVAVDLRTGGVVVLARSDLARAVRASMAVPGFFAPVRLGDTLLVDGGIGDNVPVAVARAEGAAFVVASDVVRPRPEVVERFPLDVAARALRLLLRRAPLAEPDVLVLPDISPGISEALFPRDPTPLIRAGYEAALRDAGGRLPASGGAAPRAPAPPPDSLLALRVESSDAAVAALARRVLRSVAPAEYSETRVLRALDRLYATGLATGVWPRVEPRAAEAEARATAGGAAGRDGELVVDVTPAERTRLLAAAGYDNDRGGRVWMEASRRTGTGAPLELALGGSLGSLGRWAAASLRLHPLATAPLAWTAGAHHAANTARVPGGERDVQRTGGWLGAELLRLQPTIALAATVTAEHVRQDVGRDGASFGPLLRVAGIDPLNRLAGAAPLLELEARVGTVSYQRARVRAAADAAPGRWRLAALADVTAASADAPADVLPALGDEWLMPGMRWGEERGTLRVVAGADVVYPLPLQASGRLRLRAGAATGDADALRESSEWALGAALEVLWATPLGPIIGGVGANTRGQWRLEVDLGPRF